MAREILHAHRDGWETALDNPRAVVVDYPSRLIRQGTDKVTVSSRQQFAFLAFMLRSVDVVQARAAISQAVHGHPDAPDSAISRYRSNATPTLRWLGMTLETVQGDGLRLHSDPRNTLPCPVLASSPQLPTHVRLLRHGRLTRLASRMDLRSGSAKTGRTPSRSRTA